MQRRLQRSIPEQNLFRLEIFERGAGYIAVNDTSRALRRKDKIKAREQNPAHFAPYLSHTFPGFDMLPVAISQGLISLSGSDIESRGKALGIPLKDGYWINIHLRMHGHVVAISNHELAGIKEVWETHPDSVQGKVNIMLALVNQDNEKQSIIVVDRIKLATLTFVLAAGREWWSSKQGPCPITQWESFGTHYDSFKVKNTSNASIFATMTKRQYYFNGIGTSHANEILHLAMEQNTPPKRLGLSCKMLNVVCDSRNPFRGFLILRTATVIRNPCPRGEVVAQRFMNHITSHGTFSPYNNECTVIPSLPPRSARSIILIFSTVAFLI